MQLIDRKIKQKSSALSCSDNCKDFPIRDSAEVSRHGRIMTPDPSSSAQTYGGMDGGAGGARTGL